VSIMAKDIEPEEAVVLEQVKDEEEIVKEIPASNIDVTSWHPRTGIGKRVKAGEITTIDYMLDNSVAVLEAEIVDVLLPNLESDLLMVGQSKGKFGGGQRRVFKQTQKKTEEGNKPKFSTYAVVGNKNGYVGAGMGKAKETVPAREKAFRNAKLNIMKIRRGCGSWQCSCRQPHSIPFQVSGKCGSVIVKFMPAPRGTGLCAEKECAKILKLAGISDVWSKTYGQTESKINMINACMAALRKLVSTKITSRHYESLGIVEGALTEAKQ
jgi:small subunit ribosomal protein S5